MSLVQRTKARSKRKRVRGFYSPSYTLVTHGTRRAQRKAFFQARVLPLMHRLFPALAEPFSEYNNTSCRVG